MSNRQLTDLELSAYEHGRTIALNAIAVRMRQSVDTETDSAENAIASAVPAIMSALTTHGFFENHARFVLFGFLGEIMWHVPTADAGACDQEYQQPKVTLQ